MFCFDPRFVGSLLGAAAALALISAPGIASGEDAKQWAQHIQTVLAPDGAVNSVLRIETGEDDAGGVVSPLTVELRRTPTSDGTYAVVAEVLHPFDLRGSSYWVESSVPGVQKKWVYVPALRRVRQVDDDTQIHPGLRTVFRLEELARVADWRGAHVESVTRDDGEWIRLMHEIPATGDRLEVWFDPEDRTVSRMTLRGSDGESRAVMHFEDYEEIAGRPVPFRVDVATTTGPDHRIEVTEYFAIDGGAGGARS